jgi:hypothetical protein
MSSTITGLSSQKHPTPSDKNERKIWGDILNDYLLQISPKTKGGLHYSPTDLTTSFINGGNLTSVDEGLTFVNTTENKIKRWNGTVWVPILSSGGTNSNAASTSSTSFGLVGSKVGTDTAIKNIKSGSNITITDSGTELTISGSATGEVNTISNVGTGAKIAQTKVSSNIPLRTLKQGTNVTIIEGTDEITIHATSTGEVNTISNVGTGIGIAQTKNGANTPLKTLVAGANVTLSSSTNEITINASSSGETNTNTNVGSGAKIAQVKSGVNTPLRTIKGGNNITAFEVGDEIVINSTVAAGEVNSVSNIGTGKQIAKAKNVLDYPLRTLVEGANIKITQTTDELKIEALSTGEANTNTNVGIGAEIAQGKSGVNTPLRKLKGESGVKITQNADDISIAIDPNSGYINDIQTVGNGFSIFKEKVGNIAKFRRIKGLNGIEIIENTDDISIGFPNAGEANTISNAGAGGAGYAALALPKNNTTKDIPLRRLKAGTGITLTENPDEILIDASGGKLSIDKENALNLGSDNGFFHDKSGHLVATYVYENIGNKPEYFIDFKKHTRNTGNGSYAWELSFYPLDNQQLTLPVPPSGYEYEVEYFTHCRLYNYEGALPYSIRIALDPLMGDGNTFGSMDHQNSWFTGVNCRLDCDLSANAIIKLAKYTTTFRPILKIRVDVPDNKCTISPVVPLPADPTKDSRTTRAIANDIDRLNIQEATLICRVFLIKESIKQTFVVNNINDYKPNSNQDTEIT